MKVVDIADDIYRDLGEPDDTSIPPIAYWLRNNVGKLNSAINKQYYVDDTSLEILQIDPNDPAKTEEIGADEVTIFKIIYSIHYWDLTIRKQSLSYNTHKALEITSDGHTVRLVSPTEVGKNLASVRRMLADDLKTWTTWYRVSRATPRQVVGDDTIPGQAYYSSRPPYHRAYYQ
jgi:hypothetical protein